MSPINGKTGNLTCNEKKKTFFFVRLLRIDQISYVNSLMSADLNFATHIPIGGHLTQGVLAGILRYRIQTCVAHIPHIAMLTKNLNGKVYVEHIA